MQKEELIKEIKEAFKDVPFPGYSSEDIATAPWHFKGEHMEGFIGKKWTEIDADFLNDGRQSTLAVMTCKAIRYYLPGFLLASLEDKTAYFGATILYFLNPWLEGFATQKEYRIMRLFETFDPLSLQHKKVIRSYLLYLYKNGDESDKEDILLALNHYWKDFRLK